MSIAYMKVPERFADLINGYIYQGEEMVKPEDIHEMDRSEIRIRKTEERLAAQVLERDVVCRIDKKELRTECWESSRNKSDDKCAELESGEKTQVLVVALENQSEIHYAMPVRIMNEDAIRYEQQMKDIRREHRRRRDIVGAEYLSGFSKEDHLIPVFTIVLYFGTEEWDGPRCLHDMLDFSECEEEMKGMIADYSINLLEVRKFPNLEYFHTDLRHVFGFLQNEENMWDLNKYIQQNKNTFSGISEDAYDFISVMSHSERLEEMKEQCQGEEGEVNMCKAIDDMIKEGERTGIERGIDRMAQLTSYLLRENRIDDLKRAAVDRRYTDELLQKYQF